MSFSSFMSKVPMDQLCFLCAQLLSLSYSFLYRHWFTRLDAYSNLDEEKKTRNVRLLAMAIPGLIFSYICFGNQIFHLINLATFTYLLLQFVGPELVHLAVLIGSIGYLSYFHFDRLMNPEDDYSLEITAPMMIVVQKVTVVAFNLHDGHAKLMEKKNDNNQNNYSGSSSNSSLPSTSLSESPTILEYVAYIFNYQSIICGPLIFYDDFVEFVDNVKLRRHNLREYPSARNSILKKLLICAICSILMLTMGPDYSVSFLKSPQFSRNSLVTKLFLLYFITMFARLKYYFAWSISESICNGSGLGFNGINEKTGKPNWNLASNIDIWGYEVSLSQRDALSYWNKTTEQWLRMVAYDRLPHTYKLPLTYILSAVWHGFHPGYYMTFISGALFTKAARNVRRLVRYRFIPSQPTKAAIPEDNSKELFYHSATFLATRIAMAYLVFPFIVLEFWSSIAIYRELYFCVHLAAGFVILVLPSFLEPEPEHSSSSMDHSAGPNNNNRPVSTDKSCSNDKPKITNASDEMKIFKLLQQSQPEFHNGSVSNT